MRLFTRANVLTWANGLSAVRLVAGAPCAYAVATNEWVLAMALFIVAVVTDVADGIVARRRGEVSSFGGLLDHTSDAVFVAVTLAAFASRGDVPSLLPVLVAIAFTQYLLDSRALAGQALRASRLGRWNGIGYFVIAGVAICSAALDLAMHAWVMGAAWVLVASTIVSMFERWWALARLRRGEVSDRSEE